MCRTRKPVDELIRVAKEKTDGGFRFFIDKCGNANGRGAHICKTCIEKCIKTKALNRSFKCNVPQEIYEELLRNFKGEK